MSSLHFFFWNFLNEDIYAHDFKTIKEMKDAIVSELGHSHSQTVDKFLKDSGDNPSAGGNPAQETSNGVVYSKHC